jgi:hypothetical protein
MPRHTGSQRNAAASTVCLLEGNPFGPQSQWSALLEQREHLRLEINHTKQYLEQLRKDLGQGNGEPNRLPANKRSFRQNSPAVATRRASARDPMEQVLVGWLEQLEEKFGAVATAIEGNAAQNGWEPSGVEESMLSLLRAVG